MTRTQRQTTGRPLRARRSPSGSAATPQRSTPAMRCRPLSSAELALVVGVLLGGTVEVPTAPATQTTASAPASGRDAHPQPCPDARACRNRGREPADGLPARWKEIIRLARQWEPYGGPPEEDLCPIRTSAPRLPGPARSHQFAPSPRRGTAFSRVTSPQGRARSPGADRATSAQITRRTARSIETTLNDATVHSAATHHQPSATNLMS